MWEGPEKVFTVTKFQKAQSVLGLSMEIPVTLILAKTCSYFRTLQKQPQSDVFLFYSYTTNLFPRGEIHPSAEDSHASLYSTEDWAQEAVKKTLWVVYNGAYHRLQKVSREN